MTQYEEVHPVDAKPGDRVTATHLATGAEITGTLKEGRERGHLSVISQLADVIVNSYGQLTLNMVRWTDVKIERPVRTNADDWADLKPGDIFYFSDAPRGKRVKLNDSEYASLQSGSSINRITLDLVVKNYKIVKESK